MNKLSKTSLSIALALSITPIAYADNLEMNTAHLQAMDKITGRVSELNIPVNGLANFGTFSILVRKCVTKSPEETPENTAFIDIVDNYKSQNPINIFKGWMFSSTPGINGVEHPIYDIWLLKCYNSDRTKHLILTDDQLKFRDELPMIRQEKLEYNIKLSALDEDISQDELKDIKPNTDEQIIENDSIEENKTFTSNDEINKNDTITLDIDENNILENSDKKTITEDVISEEDFVAEGEELISEPLIIDNQTVAQDEESQKTIEENIEKENPKLNIDNETKKD